MAHRLTVLIPCKDERRHIRRAIAGARALADEVLVADSGSTDGTLELARAMGCRVIERAYGTSGDFKNWAIPQAAHEWVLILDADEWITPQLAREVRAALSAALGVDGFELRRVNCFFGKPLRHGGWARDRLVRLFRRDAGRYQGSTDHAIIALPKDRVGRLRAPLMHDAVWSYGRYLAKLDRYADVQSAVWAAEGRRPSFLQLLFRGPLRFAQDYLWRLGVLDGGAGLQCALLVAFGSYLKQARFWQRVHGGAARRELAAVGPATPPRASRLQTVLRTFTL